MRNYIKIGVAGPVGAGKTALIEKLTREIASRYSVFQTWKLCLSTRVVITSLPPLGQIWRM